ncbi:MAG TPA: type IV secretory system conjugative DNA transfer family protein [Planctomycetaceae bacterium]|nr:type IV secretory system conjugative DNA transfer family protein [Planctomycetaceae bacterium]
MIASALPSSPTPGDSVLLGRRIRQRQSGSVGFRHAVSSIDHKASGDREILNYRGESHLITVAPTGTGKTTGCIIPNALSYPGSMVIVDVKSGELTRVTARRRREMGQEVVVLDPFHVTDEQPGGLSPLEIFSLPGSDLEADAEMLAALFGRENFGVKDPFWDQHGMALLAAVTAVVARLAPAERKLSKVFEYLLADDTVYNLAVLLDTLGKEIPKSAYREIAAFLQMPEITRGGVLATTLSYLKTLHSPSVLQSLESTTFSLPDFIAGRPMTIYLVLPVDKIQSHRSVLKLWIGTLLKAIVSRTHRPEHRTLLMIDECGQLGHFPFLETFITLCRGFSCSVWTCWQDLEQLKAAYPVSWKTLLNNCGILQAFGFTNRDLTEQWSTYLDTSPSELRALARDEAIVSIAGQGEHRVRMLNYLRDREFAGQFEENPLYAPGCPQMQSPGEAAIPPLPNLPQPRSRRKRSGGDAGEGGLGARQS